jgi:hypothetical protein
MRHLKPLAVFATVAAAMALSVPSGSFAGTPVDPNQHDFLFGVEGGLRYAMDTMAYNSDNSGFAEAEAGCGDQSWHLIGGGATAGGAAAHSWLAFDQPEDYTDADFTPDDGFLGSGFGPTGASLTTYSICAQSTALSYRVTDVPDQSTSVRNGKAMCLTGWHVTSGSVAIATSGSWATSSFPIDDTDPGTVRDNGWRGIAHDTLNGIGGYEVAAICAHGVTLRYRTASPRTVAPGHPVTTNVECYPKVEHVVGGGASVSGSADDARLVASRPFDGSDPDGIPDNGWQTTVYNLSGGSKTVRTFAICLRS